MNNLTQSTSVRTKTVFGGVAALARETGFSQPYVSKLLARGYGEGDIRQKAMLSQWKREIRELKSGAHRPITLGT